ncbi:MAG: hypothetical protein ABIF71_01140 [Planctomycetota bacterium]
MAVLVERDRYYLPNIPMDEETPPGRYLRPQAMVEEYITRHWAWPVSYRSDLGKARSGDTTAAEKARFGAVCDRLDDRLAGVVTDSQAMDVMHRWVPAAMPLTTFSIVMINSDFLIPIRNRSCFSEKGLALFSTHR